MSKAVETINPQTGVFTAADIFLKHTFRRLPVLDNDKIDVSKIRVLSGSGIKLKESISIPD